MLSSATRDSDTGKGRMDTWPLIELLSLLGQLYLLRKSAIELISRYFRNLFVRDEQHCGTVSLKIHSYML
jgi:hypothetical protein